jgi:hypothetical protein
VVRKKRKNENVSAVVSCGSVNSEERQPHCRSSLSIIRFPDLFPVCHMSDYVLSRCHWAPDRTTASPAGQPERNTVFLLFFSVGHQASCPGGPFIVPDGSRRSCPLAWSIFVSLVWALLTARDRRSGIIASASATCATGATSFAHRQHRPSLIALL